MWVTNWLKTFIALALIAGIITGLLLLPITEYLARALETIETLGPWGPVVLAALYVVACVLMVPGWILSLGAGFLFGVIGGSVTISIASVLGATAAFLIGRNLARNWVDRRMATQPKFQAIDRAVGQQGFKIVLLVRLSPLFPFNLLNYAFGLTRVSLTDYVLASWLGMLPGTIMYVYLGSAARNLAELAAGDVQGGIGQRLLFAFGLLMTVIVALVVTRIAKRALNEAVVDRTSMNLGRAGAE